MTQLDRELPLGKPWHKQASTITLNLLIGVAAGLVFWVTATSPYTDSLVRLLLPSGEKTAWYLSRASAIMAYLFLTASVLWGLALSTKIVREWVAPPLALALHNVTSWTAIGLAMFHAFVLLFDSYFSYSVSDLFVPFTGPYRPLNVGLGILSIYGLVLVASSFYARKWMGQQTWRRLHYLSFVLYLLVSVHGFTSGTDSGTSMMMVIYGASVLSVLLLTGYRVLTAIASPTKNRVPHNTMPQPAPVMAVRTPQPRLQQGGREGAYRLIADSVERAERVRFE